MSRLRQGAASSHQQEAWGHVQGSDEGDRDPRLLEGWVPQVNRWGGWFGRDASPGETRAAFVGEVLGEAVTKPWWPPLYGGWSGGYLWRCLLDAGFPGHQMYFTNAVKQLGQREDLAEELHEEVLPEVIIALGQVASKSLWEYGVSHIALPHPSFWRRFHYRQRDQYIYMLKESLRG